MVRRFLPALLPIVLLLARPLAAAAPAEVALPPGAVVIAGPAALQPATSGGFAQVDRELRKLLTHQRLLIVGAHPDDEDTSLLALVSRGMGGEVAYLSLSRGEGGQDLIGPELGADLGLIRTSELLAARQVDGGRQFFTRAYDFGFTLSLEETLRQWPRDVLLEDAVRVIRRFRPQVVMSVFPNDGRGGHGQHQAAGTIAHEAFALAGQPDAFPGLAAEGLTPWRPQALYRSGWFDKETAAQHLKLGGLDPWTGKSMYQLAMASRSLHRSQDMGRLQDAGPQETRLIWVAGGAGAAGQDPFAGIDTRLAALAHPLPPGEAREALAAQLREIEAGARSARSFLLPGDLAAARPGLADLLTRLLGARRLAGEGPSAAGEALDEKIAAAGAALLAAAGIVVDATAERERLIEGQPCAVRLSVWNASPDAVTVEEAGLVSPAGWKSETPAASSASSEGREVAAGALADWGVKTEVPPGAQPTVPYFLRRQLLGSIYDWRETAAADRGLPFQPPPLLGRFRVRVGAVPVEVLREVTFRANDEAVGEVRRPLRAVPAVEIAVEPRLIVWPLGQGATRTLRVSLSSNSAAAIAGRVEIATPAGWPAPEPAAFSLEPGGRTSLALALRAPQRLESGRFALRAAAVTAEGARFALALPVIDYPHIAPVARPIAAEVQVSAADLRLPPLQRVGYVRGASDRVPEALTGVGVPLTLLTESEMREGDLGGYDAIVIGSRAYETDAALRQSNPRLLDYVRRGGLLIVQYQQYPFIEGNFAPLPLTIARPHDRVTDETAPVKLLDPAAPVFTTPNAIRDEDWAGWVQERGLYFAHTWDPAYAPLLEMSDPGGPPQQGSLLISKLGQGTYVYTGLAFFRQLPAGVPGAYRLFANLLGLGHPETSAR